MNKKTMQQCPLCKTMLPYEKWLKVVGVYEEEQKHKEKLELQLKAAKSKEIKAKEQYERFRQKEKEMKTQLIRQQEKFEKEKSKISIQAKREERTMLQQKFQQEQKEMRRKMEKEKGIVFKKANLDGIEKGIQKQKERTRAVSKMLDKTQKERDKAMERVKQLEEMRKKGTTPQLEGLNFEDEVFDQLKGKFPEDKIEPTGQKGDIIQTVQVEKKEVDKILYECKKTKDFESKFIEKIKQDKKRVLAYYGVIVTWATKEEKDKKQNFWIEEGNIIVVHPYGVLYVAEFLRNTLIQMYSLKLSKEESESKGRVILEFMQSEEYRARIQNFITKSRDAYELLKKEVKMHLKDWDARYKIYKSIHTDIHVIQDIVQHILLYGKIPEKLPETEQFPALPIPPQKESDDPEKEIDVKDIPF